MTGGLRLIVRQLLTVIRAQNPAPRWWTESFTLTGQVVSCGLARLWRGVNLCVYAFPISAL